MAALLLFALTVRAAGSAPQRGLNQVDGVPTGPRTGLIVGQVVDSTGVPVPEAIVQMSLPKYPADLPTTPKGRVIADQEGRFFFSDLPAGDYYIRASKDGYGGGEYGQRRATGSGQRFALAENERRMDAKLTLWKYAVIGGTVIDEAGEPVIGVSVQALVKDVVNGRTKYGNAELGYLMPTATTDDRGMFRLSQLMPGRYVIAVPSTQTTVPAGLLGAMFQDYALRVEFSAAIAEVAPLGQPRTQQVGDSALLTLNRAMIPPPVSPTGRMAVYRTMYFPAATTAGAATPITVDGGEERTDLKIGLRPVSAVKVSGRLVTPDGSVPPPMSIRLIGEASAEVGEEGFETATGVSDGSGRFTLMGVPPGEYVLKQAHRLLSAASQGGTAWWASVHVTVANTDIQDLTVPLRPALRVEGRIELLGGTISPKPVRAPLVMFETPFGEAGRMVGQSGAVGNLSFATLAVAGQYIARPQEPGGWFMKSIILDGKDVTDRVFDLQSDATNIVVTFTDRASKVTGVVKDGRGAVSPTAVVLVFPTDPQRWSGYGSFSYGANTRALKSALVSRTGTYSMEGLPVGDYFIVAIDDADADGWMDPKTLEALARQATKLTIVDVEAKTVDLTVKVIR
jgi:protocatechuate 3,4-dioxygenase beta subunit